MWSAIIAHYFVSIAVNPNVPRRNVIREPYRGLMPLNSSQRKPDMAAVVAHFMPPLAGQNFNLQHRDALWVECKAPDKDTPSGWKNLMN